MAGFEVVVRPAIFPSIRPPQARPAPPSDDPTKGFCVIHGSSGQTIDLTGSYSVSSSQSRPVETSRRVDTARVYQMDDSGTVNRDNFVDIDVANRITSRDGEGVTEEGQSAFSETIQYYRPIQEAENIEVSKRNHVLRSGEETGPI